MSSRPLQSWRPLVASGDERANVEGGAGNMPATRPNLWMRFERSVLLTVATCLALLATTIMMFEAAGRGFFNHSYFWAEESVRYLMVWAFFLTIGCAGRAGHMIRTEMLVDALPPALRRIANVTTTVLGMLFAGVLFYASVPQVLRYYTMGMMTESTLDLPMWLLFLAMPIGAVLMGIYYAGAFLTAIGGKDPYAQAEAAPTDSGAMKGPML